MEQENLTILYIEDNPADVVLIEEMLADDTKTHYSLENAVFLAIGLERLAGGGIDLVLLDLSLPDSQGLATFQFLKDSARNVPIIVMTGTIDEDLAIRAVQEGAQDYLVKGQVDTHLLVRAVRYAVEREKLITKLRDALDQISTLKGLIPICASCKNIRDDKGYWHQVEAYISAHAAEVQFSHGICPPCMKKLYPEYADQIFTVVNGAAPKKAGCPGGGSS